MSHRGALSLDVLGNSVRREILMKLKRGPRTVGEIAETLPISRPATSKHLRLLLDAKMVSYETSGRENIYQIDFKGLSEARTALDQFWDESLLNIKQIAEENFKAEMQARVGKSKK